MTSHGMVWRGMVMLCVRHLHKPLTSEQLYAALEDVALATATDTDMSDAHAVAPTQATPTCSFHSCNGPLH